MRSEPEPLKSVVVVGAGNIGSHLLPHLGRTPGVGRVTVIDRDAYEAGNVPAQDITPREIGKPKAAVQVRRLHRINPALDVTAIVDAVQNVPLGRLRADLMLACVDSRATRRDLNERAWRLGTPLIDAGVEGRGLLARVTVYMPGAESACLECLWDDQDYAALEESYPCLGDGTETEPTNAPSSLGALAAAFQAIECQKLFDGQTQRAAIGQELVIDASCHRHFVTGLYRNPRCRFDHQIWNIQTLGDGGLSLGETAALSGEANGAPVCLGVEGQVFVTRLTCQGCGQSKALLRLSGRLRGAERRCGRCGTSPMKAAGSDMLGHLDIAALPEVQRRRSLCSVGVRSRDVLVVSGPSGVSHYEWDGHAQ